MELYSSLGDHLHVSDSDWSTMLDLARTRGWVPAGTVSPPVSFGPACEAFSLGEWTGSYAPALGQTVRPRDAQGLAEALKQETADGSRISKLNPRTKTEFIRFCSKGGFLLSTISASFARPSESTFRDDLLTLASQLGKPTAVPANAPRRDRLPEMYPSAAREH